MHVRNDEQHAVTAWFDSVYRRRGTRYLRPLRAYLVFLELLEAQRDDALLDVACGPGLLLQAARAYTPNLNGIDISRVAIRQARSAVPEARVVVANALRIPYRDSTFDLVTCLGSLERMLDKSQALREMARVGKPHARYCFLVRNSRTLSWRYLAWPAGRQRAASHAGADDLAGWTALFESQAFRVLRILPDQYPLHRRRQWRSLYLRQTDFRLPITGDAPLESANEFVFVLEKQS